MKIIDMHCDTIKECFLRKENLRNNSLCVDLEKMKKNNGAAQFFAVWLSMPKNWTERACMSFFSILLISTTAKWKKTRI